MKVATTVWCFTCKHHGSSHRWQSGPHWRLMEELRSTQFSAERTYAQKLRGLRRADRPLPRSLRQTVSTLPCFNMQRCSGRDSRAQVRIQSCVGCRWFRDFDPDGKHHRRHHCVAGGAFERTLLRNVAADWWTCALGNPYDFTLEKALGFLLGCRCSQP
jgi:hypothetical protein